MVRKGSKRGLNTGNTIRYYHRYAAIRKFQKYGCLVVGWEVGNLESAAAKEMVKELANALPAKGCNTLEFSLNKQRRWELPDYLKAKIVDESGNTDLQITVMEHNLEIARQHSISERNSCISFYSNIGQVQECVSNTEMNIESAKRGHRECDHLSRLERRAYKKMKSEGREEPPDETAGLPKYECHVGYGVQTNGKLFKNLATKVTTETKKNRTHTTGCSKRFTSKRRYLNEMDMQHSDDDVYGAEYTENTTSEPIQASLADFLNTTTVNPFRSRLSSGDSADSNAIHVMKRRIVYIDTPRRPDSPSIPKVSSVVPISLEHTKPYTPEYTEILVARSDIDMTNLSLNFGDKYAESFCTPRLLTLNLSEDISTSSLVETFYLIMVERAEGNDNDRYRVYCAGSNITVESSAIPTLEDGAVYELSTLIELAVAYGLRLQSDRVRSKTVSSVHAKGLTTTISSLKWNVKSSYLSDLTSQEVTSYHKQSAINILNHKDSLEEFVYIPTRYQRALSCNLQCGICFEDLNDQVFHSAILPCQHYFCNECWSTYLTTNIREGLVQITCPEYECKRQVDPVFVMAMTDFTAYSLHEGHLAEYSLFSQRRANWCPTSGCSRLLHCDDELAVKDEPISARCACGAQCCFKCLGDPHWPLTCIQITKYHAKLTKDGLKELITFSGFSEIVVDTKPCPQCHTPIDKDGGCIHMVCCRCHTAFCWKCGQRYIGTEYYHECKTGEMKYTSTEFSCYLPNTANSHYDAACRHRLYKAPFYRNKFVRYTRQLVSSASFKSVLHFQSHNTEKSLRRYLNQAVRQLLDAHNLLEYCSAVNMYKKGPKHCVPVISLLTYQLYALERALASDHCTKRTLAEIVKSYEIVKSNTDKLVNQMAASLSFVKPIFSQ